MFNVLNAVYTAFLPLTFQLRYVGFIYFFSVFLLCIAVQMRGREKKVLIPIRIVSSLLGFTIVLNMLPWINVCVQRINRSVDTRTTLYMLRDLQLDEQQLQISIFCKDFTGIHYNLQEDFDLEYSYEDFEGIGEIGGFIPTFSDWVYYRIIDTNAELVE